MAPNPILDASEQFFVLGRYFEVIWDQGSLTPGGEELMPPPEVFSCLRVDSDVVVELSGSHAQINKSPYKSSRWPDYFAYER